MNSTSARAWSIAAALTMLACFGCNRAERTYPTIQARSPDGGNVTVRGTYNRCPLALFVAAPDHTSVGQAILLTAMASDQDNQTLTYSWTASAGSGTPPSAPTTTFTCTTNGAIAITLVVSDSLCPSATSGVVICQPAADGGVPDGGTADTGGQSGAAGGAGAGGLAGMGGSMAGRGGMGGAGGMAGGTAGSGTAGSSGGAGGTMAGSGGTSAGGSGGGGVCVETNASPDIAAACTSCLAANIAPATDGCCGIADSRGLQLCQAASACMRSGNCNFGGDVSTCYCGSNSGTCDVAGQANGPCVSAITAAAAYNVMTRAMDSPTAAQVIGRQGDSNYAYGRAANVHSFAGGPCAGECGL